MIRIARRLFRSGESEYLLNGRACRLRDIQEIFLGTGLGSDTYAIIEQGRIGQVISAKPYELRGLLEEAAGVTKFKAKRKLAWAKLESSKQNLARVSDILEEIRRQVNSLQRQAAKARRYGELRGQLQGQLRLLLASRYRETEQQATRAALEVSLLSGSLREQLERIDAQEKQQQAGQELCRRDEAELRQAVEDRSALRVAAERARSQFAAQSQQVQYLNNRIEEAATELEQWRAQREAFEQERSACASVLETIRAESATLHELHRRQSQESLACQRQLTEKADRLEQLRQQMLETVHRCATLHNQVAQIEQFLETTARQTEQAEGRLAAAETAQESAARNREESQAAVMQHHAALEALAGQRNRLEESLRTARAEQAQQRDLLEQLRAELAAGQARLQSLGEILARRAYTSETVQRLFEAQTAESPHVLPRVGHPLATAGGNGGATLQARFQPMGVLADFLEVDPAYERVAEEFLREELDYVVVQDWEAASEAVRLLRSEVPGRATFLLHSAVHKSGNGNGNGHSLISEENAESLPGVVGKLENYLRFTNGLSGSAGNLLPKLQRCYLAADAEVARTLAGQQPDSYFLTPEGDWFHGPLVTAGKADFSGPLALKRELRELSRQVSDKEAAAEKAVEQLSRAIQLIEEQQASLESLTTQQQESEKQLMVAERDLREGHERWEQAAERLTLLRFELEHLGRETENARERRDSNLQEISLREQQRADLEAETTTLRQAIGELEAARTEAQARAAETQSRLAALGERERAGAEALERVERSTEQLARRLAERNQQIEQWYYQKSLYEEGNRQLEQQAAEAERRAEELVSRMEELESDCRKHRQLLAEMELKLQQSRHELEGIRNRKTEAEVQLARQQSDLEHLRQSCRNELQVEIEALAAEDLPLLGAEEIVSAEEQCRQLKTKIENLGPINMVALEEFEECRQRHEFLERQRQDLLDSIQDTTQAIQEIDEITHRQFREAFEQINAHFQRTFETLFGGGQGFLRLTEAEDPSEAGIEIVAQPPGKRLQNVLLLSGGEKALAAMALLLAIFRYRPSPFCILDEVDAPLDEANISRFTTMVQEMSGDTQFLLITHSKKTMSIAPTLYGVTMEEPGVSKIVSVKFNGTPAPAPQRQMAATLA